MRAILDNDIILGWTTTGGVDVGDSPAGVGLERLRFDGSNIIDLAGLSTIQVVKESGVFILHAVAVNNSQPVQMGYNDRKILVDDAGGYRLKTVQELSEELVIAKNSELKANLRVNLAGQLGDTPDQIADLSKCIILILEYLAGGDSSEDAKAVIDSIAPDFANIYSTTISETTLKNNAAVLKSSMADYYSSLI